MSRTGRAVAVFCSLFYLAVSPCAIFAQTPVLSINGHGVCFDPSDQITVTVDMSASKSLICAGQFNLNYDTSRLDFVSIEPGGDGPFTFAVFEKIDHEAGFIKYAVGPSTSEGCEAATHGPATLAHITFEVIAPGPVYVRFADTQLPAILSDPKGNLITPVRQNLDPLAPDVEPPIILHGNGMPGETRPFTGFVDSRAESSDGNSHDLGLTEVVLVFNEPVFAPDLSEVSTNDFEISVTGGVAPVIESVDASNNPVIFLRFDPANGGAFPLKEWTTIRAIVIDECERLMADVGNLGPGVDETDRVDILNLPADVNQDFKVTPFDILYFRQISQGIEDPPKGVELDFIDSDRDGQYLPFDLLRLRQIYAGTPPALQVWDHESAESPRP